VGGFSQFFLHRCTLNEDVDLGLKIARIGRILFCPAARMTHLHAPGGRVSVSTAAEDDLYNRYLILRRTCGRSIASAWRLVLLYFLVETTSNLAGCLCRLNSRGFGDRLWGRIRALCRILGLVTSCC
jgi:GT2 family glycosyltransferase